MDVSKQEIKLPSSFFETYLQYKASTATVLYWLNEHGAVTTQPNLTTDDLQGAVERIRGKGIRIPENIHSAFKASIAKRRKVTEWFTSVELATGGKPSKSTAQHNHYTKKLQEAFSTLFRSENDGLVQKQPPKIDIASDESILRDTSNRFALLNNPSEEIEDFQSTQSSGITSQGAFEDGEEKSQSLFCPVLQDDPIEALIEIHLVVRELDSLCETIKGFWEEASDKILPLPVAAWLTNASYQHVKLLCTRIEAIDNDAQEHQDVYVGIINQYKIVFSSHPTDPKYDDFTQGRGMTFPWIAIAAFKNDWDNNREPLSKTGWQDPVKFISPHPKFGDDIPDDCDTLAKNIEAYKMLLKSISEQSLKEDNHVIGTGFIPSDMNPLVHDFSTFLRGDNPHPSLPLVFGLHLLLEISKSFIWKKGVATKTNCRLQALHFAKDVRALTQIDLLPSKDHMIARMKDKDTEYLDNYLTEKCFDLYFQSPWTAGFHMCEILHHSIDAGLRLCNSEGNVGAVLHMYNALRQIGFMEAVPLLDELCQVFKQELCLGLSPTTNFSSNFRRFLGGKSQPKFNAVNVRQSGREIGMPPSLPTAQDYAKRFMPSERSRFYQLHNDGFRPTMDFWSKLYTGKAASSISKSQRDTILKDLNDLAFTDLLKKLREEVLREFLGQMPVASIQYSAIFALCQQILKEMVSLKLQEADKDVALANTISGFVFVETLLISIVEHQKDVQMSKLLPHLTSLHLARRAILKFCAGKQLIDFIWKY